MGNEKEKRFNAEKDAGKMLSHSCALAFFGEVIRGMKLMETIGLRTMILPLLQSSTAIGYQMYNVIYIMSRVEHIVLIFFLDVF